MGGYCAKGDCEVSAVRLKTVCKSLLVLRVRGRSDIAAQASRLSEGIFELRRLDPMEARAEAGSALFEFAASAQKLFGCFIVRIASDAPSFPFLDVLRESVKLYAEPNDGVVNTALL